MASVNTEGFPNLAEVLGQVLARVAPERQPLLVAIAERLAAERYRGWAGTVAAGERARLMACAEREEEIARRVEALHADAAAVQRAILDANPDLLEINRSLFAGRPLIEQLAIQAQGERLGAATWRAFAAGQTDEARRATLLGCAELEEQNALALDAIVDAQPD